VGTSRPTQNYDEADDEADGDEDDDEDDDEDNEEDEEEETKLGRPVPSRHRTDCWRRQITGMTHDATQVLGSAPECEALHGDGTDDGMDGRRSRVGRG